MAKNCFGKRQVVLGGDLDIRDRTLHQTRNTALALDRARLVGDVVERTRAQRRSQRAYAKHLWCLRAPHTGARQGFGNVIAIGPL